MIIDVHTHMFSPGLCGDRKPFLADRQFRAIYGDKKATVIEHSALLAYLDGSGIDHAVAMGFPWERSDLCASQNDYFRKVNGLSGGKIIPFGSVPVNDTVDVASCVREIKDAGLRGIGEVGFYSSGITAWSLDFLKSILAAARDHRLPVCIHVNEPVGHKYPGKYEPGFGLLYEALADYQEVPVILSHWGGGLLFYELMPEVSKALAHCHYDTAASPFIYSDAIYSIAPQITGPGRILFGSDFPLLPYKRYIDPIARSITEVGRRADIMGRNAARFLNII
ncbi:MAG: amidohydrolase family protein [Spirochaetes bacterium]|nr:amidohydrolase family protein [Spirochaetota bacterium]